MYDLIIRDATIVASTGRLVADVAIKDGKIAYVGPRPPRQAKREISAIGKFLMPGVIDTAAIFTHRPSGKAAKEQWSQESRAAVSGGITTTIILPDGEKPVIDKASATRRDKIAKGSSWCNYGLWGLATGDNSAVLSTAAADGEIVGTLMRLGKNTNSLPTDKVPMFVDVDGVLGVQLLCDDPNNIRPNAEGVPTESIEAQAVMEAAQSRKIHWIHVSTGAELELLDPVRGDLPVTSGITPHHLFLSRDDSDLATVPPIRSEQDRRTLWTAVRRGRLDCMASDHHPSSQGEVGSPGAELLFPLLLSAVRAGRLSLETLVSLIAEAPAEIFGLTNKGRIEKGADADLILFAEGSVTRVKAGELLSSAGWSPYGEREAAPKPDLVIVGGQIAAVRGEVVAKKPMGVRI